MQKIQHSVASLLAQSGTHEQLIKQDGIYRRFVESRELAVGWKV